MTITLKGTVLIIDTIFKKAKENMPVFLILVAFIAFVLWCFRTEVNKYIELKFFNHRAENGAVRTSSTTGLKKHTIAPLPFNKNREKRLPNATVINSGGINPSLKKAITDMITAAKNEKDDNNIYRKEIEAYQLLPGEFQTIEFGLADDTYHRIQILNAFFTKLNLEKK